MKFKREDLGLYFAFMLMGAGAGLLAGSIISSIIERRRKSQQADGSVEVEYDPNWAIKERKAIEEELARMTEEQNLRVEHAKLMSKGYRASGVEWKAPEPKEHEEEKPRKKNTHRSNNSIYSDEELKEFIIEHNVGTMHQEMLRNGYMTMDQVLGVMEEEALAMELPEQDYGSQYRSYYTAAQEEAKELEELSKDEIAILVDELGIVNDRYRITSAPPEHASELLFKEVQWDEEDNSFYFLRRGAPIAYDIRTGIGHDTWEVVVKFLVPEGKLTDVYVEDMDNGKLFAFHKLADLDEDEPPVGEDLDDDDLD